MQPPQPVIRTYHGRERRLTEEAYRLDAAQAERASWYPVAHRWVTSWAGDELSVVFEFRGPHAAPFMPMPSPSMAVQVVPSDDLPDVVGPLAQAAVAADPWMAPGSALTGAADPVSDAETSEPVTPEADQPDQPEPDAAAEPVAQPEAPAWAMPAAAPKPIAPTQAMAAPAPGRAHFPQPSSRPAVRAHARAVVQSIDLHAAGEPLRLIRSGFPPVPAMPILERRRWLKENADYARRVLMWEPRGHRDMYGAILLPPFRDDADIAVLFMHNDGYSTMCGHGIIAITTGLIEEGLYPAAPPETMIHFETPAGLVTASAKVSCTADGRNEVASVRFRNVPAYLHTAGLKLQPDGVTLHGGAAAAGSLNVDLAFGGAYYGVVDAADLGLRVVPEQTDALTRAGAAITDVLRRDHAPTHPTDHDLGFVYGTIIVDHAPATSPDGLASLADIRNVTIFAEAEVDRSPCGSGTSALLAQMHALGRLDVGREIANSGITGEVFRGRIEEETALGEHPAVVTSVEGRAFVIGYSTFVVDDRDPLGNGFLLR